MACILTLRFPMEGSLSNIVNCQNHRHVQWKITFSNMVAFWPFGEMFVCVQLQGIRKFWLIIFFLYPFELISLDHETFKKNNKL